MEQSKKGGGTKPQTQICRTELANLMNEEKDLAKDLVHFFIVVPCLVGRRLM